MYRWGHKRANNPEDQWVIPVSDKQAEQGKDGASAGGDPFTKMKQDKEARAEKQEKKEKKNKMQAKLEKARSQASAGSKLKDGIHKK
jgi:Ribosome biogenesis regulatory protein (RRS1)